MLQEPPWYIDPNYYITRDPLEIYYFTDGSVSMSKLNKGKGSSGFARIDTTGNQQVVKIYPPSVEQVTTEDINMAEAHAIDMALDDIRRYTINEDKISICTDSKTISKALITETKYNFSDSNTTQEVDKLKRNYSSISEDRDITVVKVKGHSNITGQKKEFKKANGYKISNDEALFYNRGNDYIDGAVRMGYFSKKKYN